MFINRYCLFFLFVLGRGTGWRHRVNEWPISPVTGRSHKMVIPAVSPNKKVLVQLNV